MQHRIPGLLAALGLALVAAAPDASAENITLKAVRFPTTLNGTSGPTTPPTDAPLSQVIVFEFSGAPVVPPGVGEGLRIRVDDENSGGQTVGSPAFGTYRVSGNKVIFTPRLPSAPLPEGFGTSSDVGADTSLPGLLPSTTYAIDITLNTPNSVLNLKKAAPKLVFPILFTTTAATNPSGLFDGAADTAPKLKKDKIVPADGTKGLHPNVFTDPAGLFTSIGTKKRPPFKLSFKGPLNPDQDNLSPANIRLRAIEAPDGSTVDVELGTTLVLGTNDAKSSQVLVFPDGVLPLGHRIVLEVSNKLQSLSGANADPTEDPPKYQKVATYRVANDPTPGVAIDDALVEEFDTTAQQDTTIAAAGDQLASWDTLNSNSLRASFGFGGDGSLGRFEPPNQTFDLVLDTDFQVLPLFSGATPDVPPGTIVEGGVFNFTDFHLPANVTLLAEGTNPLIITCTGDCIIEGRFALRGRNGIGDDTFNASTTPTAGGSAPCGAGRGGNGHPVSVKAGAPSLIYMQTPKFGENGYGPGNVDPIGGGGGQCGCTLPHSNFNTVNNCNSFSDAGDGSRGAGGGGGSLFPFVPDFGPDIGVLMSGRQGGVGIGNHLPIDFDPGKPFPQPPTAYNGDTTINAVAKPNTNMTFAQVIQEGPPLLYDIGSPFDPNHMFAKTRKTLTGGAAGVSPFVDGNLANDFFGPGGERQQFVGGQGGGGGGSRTEGLDLRCLPLTIQSGFPLTVLDSKGGGGGAGGGSVMIQALGVIRFLGPAAQIVARGGNGGGGESISTSDQGGSGGGGSGGCVILQSATNVEMNDPSLGNFMLDGNPNTPRWVIDVSAGCADNAVNLSTTGATGQPGADSAPLQVGDGGPGGPGIVQIHVPVGAPDLVDDARIGSLAFASGFNIIAYTLGTANNFTNGGKPVDAFVDQAKTPTPLTPVSVAQSTWYDLGAVTSEFRPPIIVTGAPPVQGPVFGVSGIGPFFRGTDPASGLVTTDTAGHVVNPFGNDLEVDAPDLLQPDFIPNGPTYFQTVKVLFEGADEDPDQPGNPDLATSTGFVSDIMLLNGKRFLRWRIEFDIAAAPELLPQPETPLPQFNFLRIPFKY